VLAVAHYLFAVAVTISGSRRPIIELADTSGTPLASNRWQLAAVPERRGRDANLENLEGRRVDPRLKGETVTTFNLVSNESINQHAEMEHVMSKLYAAVARSRGTSFKDEEMMLTSDPKALEQITGSLRFGNREQGVAAHNFVFAFGLFEFVWSPESKTWVPSDNKLTRAREIVAAYSDPDHGSGYPF
jgi:hypothetical protein